MASEESLWKRAGLLRCVFSKCGLLELFLEIAYPTLAVITTKYCNDSLGLYVDVLLEVLNELIITFTINF